MLEFYLTTVVIWMIIIASLLLMFGDAIKKKQANELKKTNVIKKIASLFVMSAVPVLRLVVAATIFYMAVCSQEDFDRLMNKNK